MEKEAIIKLIKSVFITIIVSSFLSLFLVNFSFPFLYSFLFFIGIQFLFFYFYGEYIIRKNNRLKIQAELKVLEENARQMSEVICPCDRRIVSKVPIDLSLDTNKYTCPGCSKNISVFVDFKTALSTDPISLNPLDLPIVSQNDKL